MSEYSIKELEAKLYEEQMEAYGRFTRLLIGLSAGALTIVSAVLTGPEKTSCFLIWSLVLHFVSLCCGLFVQGIRVHAPAKHFHNVVLELQRYASKELDPTRSIPPHIQTFLHISTTETAFYIGQIASFASASLLLLMHFL